MAYPRWYLLVLVALVLALAACGSPGSRPAESFSLRLNPADPKLAPGGRVTVSIEITRQSSFTGPITLSLEGAPASVVASFDPNPATEDSSVVTLEAPATLATGNYSLQVRGASGAASSSAAASLAVVSVPPSTITVDTSLAPAIASREPLADGIPRPLVAMSDARGNQVDFVENELLIFSSDAAAVNALLSRWNGTLLRRADPPKGNPHNLKSVFQVRINTSSADTNRLLSDLSTLDPASRSDLKVSSQSALRLLSVAAREKLGGMDVALNVLTRPQTFEDNTSSEGGLQTGEIGNSYSANAFDWPYMRAGGIQNIGVVDAWRALERAGRINPANGSNGSVRIAIIDGGFYPNQADFHRFSGDPEELNRINPMPCSGGNDCPYHGTNVAMAAAARADNSFGTAGPAAPVAHLLLYQQAGVDDVIYSIFEAIDEDARIINMSFGVRFPAIGAFLGLAFDAITATANAYGVMLIASAGNDGESVDAEDCFIVCWEEAYWSPCENTHVICVGGLADNSVERHPGSNFGGENVDIFGPFRVYVGIDHGETQGRNQVKGGTSFSSPFVAGVAALVWAANPSLTDDQVWSILRNTAHKVPALYNPSLVARRYVNAFAAVRQALGNVPPRVVIEAPANNTSLPFRSNFTFRASSSDLDGATPLISWSSSVDGALGQGSEITRSFTSPGPRQITASVTDSGGLTRTASISVTGTNLPPTAEIISPTTTSVLVGQSVLFRGRGLDADGAFPVELPCNRLTWSSSNTADTLGSGCEFTASFASPGTRTITLRATDPYGAQESVTRTFTVNNPPPSGPPVVTILNPKDGDLFVANSNIRLSYSMTDPGGTPSSQYTVVWRLTFGSQNWTIVPKTCTLNQIPFPCFTPADYGINNNGVKLMQLRLSVTDPEGLTGTDQVNISIGLVP